MLKSAERQHRTTTTTNITTISEKYDVTREIIVEKIKKNMVENELYGVTSNI